MKRFQYRLNRQGSDASFLRHCGLCDAANTYWQLDKKSHWPFASVADHAEIVLLGMHVALFPTAAFQILNCSPKLGYRSKLDKTSKTSLIHDYPQRHLLKTMFFEKHLRWYQ